MFGPIYYDENDSEILRRIARRNNDPTPMESTHNMTPNHPDFYVDPSSTAFIDGTEIERLLRVK